MTTTRSTGLALVWLGLGPSFTYNFLPSIHHRLAEVFTLPHSFRAETSGSERFRAVLLGNAQICSEWKISEVRPNFRNISEFF